MDSRRPQSRDGFEIAIICALPLEREAVESLLDEDYEQDGYSYKKAEGDKNAYTIGRMGKQHVVVVCMPGMGTTSAAAVAVDLRGSFRKLKVALVVGICGGVPRRGGQNDIYLGDVIISTSVVQVDFGRQYPHGFQRKKGVEEVLGRADPEIRAFVGRLSGQSSKDRLEAETYNISTTASSMNGASSATYPGLQHDILYAPEHRHKHWNMNCSVCEKCESSENEVCESAIDSECDKLGCQSITASDRREARRPVVHFGRVACGNQVIKSGVHRDRLAMEENVIGFEMESAGTWDYIPTIVVKSVSDYADSHKNKRWQTYAAITAAACAKAILERWRSADNRDQKLPSRPSYPVYSTVARSLNTLFAGRHDILCNLTSIIQKAVEDGSQQEVCHIVISGMGGQGKSEICLQLAHHLGNLFWGVFWIDVSTTTLAENGFLDVAGSIGWAVSTWSAAKQRLNNIKQPWLLVLDNADDPDVDYQPYFPTSRFGVVILTSRNAECERYATKKWIDLEGLAHVDARQLLFQAARVPTTRQESLKADAQAVIQLLQSHPLALIQAGSYISHGHCSLREYPKIYERQRKRLLAFRPTQARSRYRDVYTTFEASVETLQLLGTEAACDALQLLPILSIYGPNRLPVILFEAAWEGARFVPTNPRADDRLTTMAPWHLERLPALLQIKSEAFDSFRLVEALNLLKASSVISIDGDECSMSISMHPLIHAWAWDRFNLEQQHTSWVQAGIIMALSRSAPDYWFNHARSLQPHLQAVTSWPISTMFEADPTVEVCRIIVNCGWLSYHLRNDKARLLALINSLTSYLGVERLNPVNLQWLDLYLLIARNQLDCGLSSKAVMLLEQVVKAQEQTAAQDCRDQLSSQHLLATAYRINGQVEDSMNLIERVVETCVQTLAEDDTERLSAQYGLAMAYLEDEHLKEAITLLEEVAKIRVRTSAEDDYDRTVSQYRLAIAYLMNGQVQNAVTLLEHVVKIDKRSFAEDHPDLLAVQHELARAYFANGQAEDAITLFVQVLKIRAQKLVEDQSDRRVSPHLLAEVYRVNGQVKEAIRLAEQMFEIQEQSVAADHPHRLASQQLLAMYIGETKDQDPAVGLLRRVADVQRYSPKETPPG